MATRKSSAGTMRVFGVSILSLFVLNACVPELEGSSGPEEKDNDTSVFTFEPGKDSVDIPVDTVVRIISDMALDPDSVGPETVRLLRGEESASEIAVSYENDVIEIRPANALQRNTTYTALVTGDLRSMEGRIVPAGASATFTTADVTGSDVPPPENLARWEDRMVERGRQLGEKLMGLSDYQVRNPDGATLNEVYYDGARVFYQIADYLDASGSELQRWHAYARRARDIYVKGYLEPNNYVAAGYMRFPHGTYMQWLLDESDSTLASLIKLRDKPTFSRPTASHSTWYYHKYSREIAYALHANVLAEKAGEPRQTDYVEGLLDRALTHVNIWTTGNYLDPDPNWHFVQAFMGGLTANALIAVQEHTPDGRIPPAVETLADWLWDNMWVADVDNSGYGAFKYVNRSVSGVGGPSPAPDLNMLIAPMYGWLYKETGETRFRDRGDKIFAGGAQLASLHNGKAFNQNYRASFDYLRWRAEGIQRWGR